LCGKIPFVSFRDLYYSENTKANQSSHLLQAIEEVVMHFIPMLASSPSPDHTRGFILGSILGIVVGSGSESGAADKDQVEEGEYEEVLPSVMHPQADSVWPQVWLMLCC